MSIGSALSNAISGLAATGRQASIVSDNVANAGTEGFAKRQAVVSSQQGGGVRIDAIDRVINKAVLGDRRVADASLAKVSAQETFLQNARDAIGMPDGSTGLSDLVDAFGSTLTAAAANPESAAALDQAVDAAGRLVTRFNDASATIQAGRQTADRAIADAVDRLNADLVRIADLNDTITKMTVSGIETNAMEDERQRAIDRVGELVAVREVERDNGRVALMGPSGYLLDSTPRKIAFAETRMITAGDDVAGRLSLPSVDGIPIDPSRSAHVLSGGRIEGLLAVRDRIAPGAQTMMDAAARDLVDRFADPGVDPTRAAGEPGLFTDQGAELGPDEVGLSARLALNTNVDPSAGGSAWKLRDGLGAMVQGPPGDASGLHRLSDALTAVAPPPSGPIQGRHDVAGLAGQVVSAIGADLQIAQTEAVHAGAKSQSFADRLAADGVDTDAQLQRLLTLEQAYAANARVISTAQSMLNALMEI